MRLFRAIGTARLQLSKAWELRATTSLARLCKQRGRHDEARQMLSDVYGWFTEGFDTPDLKAAKSLLNELDDFANPLTSDVVRQS
jgi:predicted ATPase